MLLIPSRSQYQTSEASPPSPRAKLIAKERSFEPVTTTSIKCYLLGLLGATILLTHLKKKLGADALELYGELESSGSSDHVLGGISTKMQAADVSIGPHAEELSPC